MRPGVATFNRAIVVLAGTVHAHHGTDTAASNSRGICTVGNTRAHLDNCVAEFDDCVYADPSPITTSISNDWVDCVSTCG